LKEALKGDDAEAIKAKTNTLAQASMKLGEAMYKQQARAMRPRTPRRTTWSTRSLRSRRRQEQQEVCLNGWHHGPHSEERESRVS